MMTITNFKGLRNKSSSTEFVSVGIRIVNYSVIQ